MPDPDDLIRALQSPDPPAEAPPWPVERRPPRLRWWAAAGAVLAAAGLVLAFGWPTEPSRARGAEPDPATFDLRMVVERGGVARRVATGAKLRLGERVMFRVSADRPTSARLWVEEPTGTSVIVETDAGPVPRDVGDGRGLVGYRFESPGRHVFHLTSGAGGECADCPSLAVEVE